MSDEAATEELTPAPPATANLPATATGPAPTTATTNGVLALQALIGNRATGRAIQRHEGAHPGPDGHTEAEHPAAGRHRTVSALIGTDDPITAIRRVSGFGRALHADDQRLQSFSSIGWLQPWMFHPTEAWLVTESHIIVQGSERSGFIRPRCDLDPPTRGAGAVHIRVSDGRWMQLVLAVPGNTVFVRPATAVDGSFGNEPSVLIASLPGVSLDTTQVRRIETLFRGDRWDEQAGDLEEGPEQAGEGATDDSAGDSRGGGGGRPRARELTAPWAMQQVGAANLERQIRARQAASTPAEPGDERPSPGDRLPSDIMALPGEVARVSRNGVRLRVRQERWETGRQLLDRLIATLDRHFLPTDRVDDPDVPAAVPDWVRHQFGGARSLLDADRRRLLPLQDDARDAAAGSAGSEQQGAVEAEARQAIERRLLERAAGLPERFELDHQGRPPYAVHIRVGRRAARIRMQQDDTPSALYARVRGVAGDLAAPVATGLRIGAEDSTLIRGQRAPYPIAIEMMNSTTAVAGRPQWFRMELDSGSEAPPRLAVTWLVAPVTGDGDDADIVTTRIAEHGAVADLEMRESLQHRLENVDAERSRTGVTFVDLDSARALAATEAIGALADGGRMVIGHIAERSAERGVLFPGPGRYVVSVIAQPDVDDSDREHTGISETNVRAASRTAISLDVVDSEERLDDLVEETLDDIERRQQLLRQIESLEQQIAALDEDDERAAALQNELAGLQAELTQLEGTIDVARGRGSATIFGYLGRKRDAADAQRALVDEIIANLGAGDDLQQRHNLLRHARRQEAEQAADVAEDGDEADDADNDTEPRIVRLYDQLHLQWARERARGLDRPPFAEWLQLQSGQLRQAADVASRQSLGLFVRGRDLGRASRLPGALIASDGRQLPLTLALHQTISAGEGDQPGSTTYQILDLSEVGAPDSSDEAPIFEGRAPGTDSQAASTALARAVATYVNEAGYGYGHLVIHRPPTLPGDIEFEPSQRFRLRPSERERWIERLENIAMVVGMVGMIASGPVGIALGVIGAGTGAAAAGLRMSHRSDRGTLDMDSETVQDVIDIATAPLAIAGAAANVRRMSRTAMLARLERSGVVLTGDAAANVIRGLPDGLNTLADIDDVVGVLQAGQQVYALPSGVIDGLTRAQSIEDPVERRAATMEALASGAIALPGALHGLHGAGGTIGEMSELHTRRRRTRETLHPRVDESAVDSSPDPGVVPRPTDSGPTINPPPEQTVRRRPESTGESVVDGTPRRRAGEGDAERRRETAPGSSDADAARSISSESERTRTDADAEAGPGRAGASEPESATHAESEAPPHADSSTPGESASLVGDTSGRAPRDEGATRTETDTNPLPPPTPELTHVITEPSATPADAERALRVGGHLETIRRQLKAMNLPAAEHQRIAGLLQAARSAIVGRHIQAVVERVRAAHRDLAIDIQNVGTRGLASDSDITVRVERIENPEHPLSDTERAELDRRLVTVSLETVPLLYAELERAGFPPERALDTNFYSELREDSFAPTSEAEARGITADQEIVSLAEIALNVTHDQWEDFQRRQLAALDANTSIPADVRSEIRARFEAEVAAAQATAERLMAGAPADVEPGDAREAALDAARRRLIEALAPATDPDAPRLGARDLRRLMADVKLLEPDAFGTRAAVAGVVLGGQGMRTATVDSVVERPVLDDAGRSRRPRRRDDIEAGIGATGPLRWDPETGDLLESSAEDEVRRRRGEAHPHTAHRRPGDESATSHDSSSRFMSAAQAIYGHLVHHASVSEVEPAHTSTAAKHLHRMAELASRMGIGRAGGDGFAHLPDIIAAKSGDGAEARTIAALRGWAGEPGVAAWASPGDLTMASDHALMSAFLRWATTQGGAMLGQMRGRAGVTAVYSGAEMGSTELSVGSVGSSDGGRSDGGRGDGGRGDGGRGDGRRGRDGGPSEPSAATPRPRLTATASGEEVPAGAAEPPIEVAPASEATRRTILPPAPEPPTGETPASEATRRTILPPNSEPATSQEPAGTAAGTQPGATGIAHLPEVQRGIREAFGREVPRRSVYEQAESDFHYRRDWIAVDPERRSGKDPPAGHYNRTTGKIHFPPHAVLETIVHESLHALTHAEFYTAFPIWLNEGITEILTEQTTGSRSPGSAYLENIEIARLLIDAVGEQRVRAAYFDGDIAPLEAALDAHTGQEGSLATLRGLLSGPGDRDIDGRTLAAVRAMLGGAGRHDERPSSGAVDQTDRPTIPTPRGGTSQ